VPTILFCRLRRILILALAQVQPKFRKRAQVQLAIAGPGLFRIAATYRIGARTVDGNCLRID
jgi:hypothetical protein